MPRYAPRIALETHEVANQPPDFVGRDLYRTDPAMREAAAREGGDWLDVPLGALSRDISTEQVFDWAAEANRHPPELVSFDRWGRRLDEVRFHPAYHALMDLGMRHRIHSIAWTAGRPGSHVAHAALLALFSQVEQGTMCPISMTYAAVPALRHQPDLAALWLPKILDGTYDAPLRPIDQKAGVTLGMAMTEKQGGSDVRANTTRATPLGGGRYRLDGHKWFCSAPMSDAFLTLAQAQDGLTCFLVPRITPESERNAIHLMRLKDKLGNRSNASAEIEYHGATAFQAGQGGRGVATIIDMVHGTRLDTMASTLGIMRMALAQAAHHVGYRRAFQKALIDQPAMRSVVADLQLDYEAAVALTLRVARAFDGADDSQRALARLGVALGKFWLTKRVSNFVYEAMECLGGAGYVEESVLPRLYREAPVNAIWEGSGNVMALDILRTLGREPGALEAYRAEIELAQGANDMFDRTAAETLERLGQPRGEDQARFAAERLALLLQGALLVRHAPPAIADAFCATRLKGDWGRAYGTLPRGLDIDAILGRVFG